MKCQSILFCFALLLFWLKEKVRMYLDCDVDKLEVVPELTQISWRHEVLIFAHKMKSDCKELQRKFLDLQMSEHWQTDKTTRNFFKLNFLPTSETMQTLSDFKKLKQTTNFGLYCTNHFGLILERLLGRAANLLDPFGYKIFF